MARIPPGRFAAHAFAVLIAMCLIVEGAARIAEYTRPAAPEGGSRQTVLSVIEWFLPGFAERDPALGFRPKVDGPAASGSQMNRQRFRGEPVALPKPDHTYRVVALGGSTTFGLGVPSGDSWPARLEAQVRSRCAPEQDVRIDMINGGVPGYIAWQNAARLRAEWLAYEPDLVITMDGLNDLLFAGVLAPAEGTGAGSLPVQGRLASRLRASARTLHTHSAAARWVVARARQLPARAKARSSESEEEAAQLDGAIRSVEEALTRSIRLVQGRARFLVVCPPPLLGEGAGTFAGTLPAGAFAALPHGFWRRLGALHTRLQALAEREGVEFLDAGPVLAGSGRSAYFLADGIHLTPVGNEAIAAAIALHLFGERCPAS